MLSTLTLDFDKLLRPIAGENPAGQDLTFVLYDDLRNQRKRMASSVSEDLKHRTKYADWCPIIDLATEALEAESKDLQITAWLLEALVGQHGFAGLRDGLRLLRELQENFWPTLYPEATEGKRGARARPLEALDTPLPFALKCVPITQSASKKMYCWVHKEDADKIAGLRQKSARPEEEKEREHRLKILIDEGKTTPEEFDNEIKETPPEFYLQLLDDLQQSQQEYDQLIEVMKQEDKFGLDNTPALGKIRETMDNLHRFLQKVLTDKRPIEADAPSEEPAHTEPAGNDTSGLPASLRPRDRADALRRLVAIADYFRETEPHSPVPSLVQRAILWEKMSLEALLQHVIQDQKVFENACTILGLKETDVANNA